MFDEQRRGVSIQCARAKKRKCLCADESLPFSSQMTRRERNQKSLNKRHREGPGDGGGGVGFSFSSATKQKVRAQEWRKRN